MQRDISPEEILVAIRTIIAKDIAARPAPRSKPVADPALWHAIEVHKRLSSEGQCGFRSLPGKP